MAEGLHLLCLAVLAVFLSVLDIALRVDYEILVQLLKLGFGEVLLQIVLSHCRLRNTEIRVILESFVLRVVAQDLVQFGSDVSN